MADSIRGWAFESVEDWERGRKEHGGYGASEVAAIMGREHNPYRTRFEVWAERTGKVPPQEQTDVMRSGHYMEDGWLRWYADRRACSVYRASAVHLLVPHPEDALAFCSPDGLVLPAPNERGAFQLKVDGPQPGGAVTGLGFAGGVDAKNHSTHVLYNGIPGVSGYGEPGSDVVPRYIWWQAQWSCYCTGAPWWDIAAGFGGQRLEVYRVPRSDRAIRLAAEAVERFHEEYVVPDVPPDETAAAWVRVEDTLRAMFPVSSGGALVATEDDLQHVYRMAQCARVASRFDSMAKAYKALLQRRMESHAELRLGHDEGHVLLTYKGGKPGTPGVDWEATARALAEEVRVWQSTHTPAPMPVDVIVNDHLVTTPAGLTSRRMLNKMATPDKAAKALALASSLGYDVGFTDTLEGVTQGALDAGQVLSLGDDDEEQTDDE